MTPEGYRPPPGRTQTPDPRRAAQVVQDIAEARDHGDLSENAEYDAAKERQGFIEGRIKEINDKIARAHVINPAEIDSDKVVFGATVTLFDAESGIGSHLPDRRRSTRPTSSRARFSINSPVGKALIGHRVDDEVTHQGAVRPAGLRNHRYPLCVRRQTLEPFPANQGITCPPKSPKI